MFSVETGTGAAVPHAPPEINHGTHGIHGKVLRDTILVHRGNSFFILHSALFIGENILHSTF
jgi:hypothetical protein